MYNYGGVITLEELVFFSGLRPYSVAYYGLSLLKIRIGRGAGLVALATHI